MQQNWRLDIIALCLACGAVVLTYFALVFGSQNKNHSIPNVSAVSVVTNSTVLLPCGPPAPGLSQQETEATRPEPTSLGEYILTAYCPCVKCCEIWSAEHPSRIGTDYVQLTASGTVAQAGRTIAVDTRVIPFGTTVIINGHEYVAEDRGGAIKRNRIDVFFNTHEEALNFGRQTAEVYIREAG